MTGSRFLEAPLVRQADGELKNPKIFGPFVIFRPHVVLPFADKNYSPAIYRHTAASEIENRLWSELE